MENKFKKTLKYIIVAALWLGIWQLLSMVVSSDLSLFLPSPVTVFKAFFALLPTEKFWKACASTLLRIFIGYILGTVTGIILALITSTFAFLNAFLSPVLKIIRAVPVVSFIILAFLFFKVDNLPIFISFLMVVPLVWQTVHDALISVDKNLLEMCKIYQVGKFKTLIFVKMPQIKTAVISAAVNGVGFAWKSGVAAEVLCTPEISIGKEIFRAKANLEYSEIYALTLTVVIFSLIFEIFFKYIFGKGVNKNVKIK